MTGNVGKNIKKRLIDLDKTAKELAEHAGVTEAYVSQLCSGKNDIAKVSLIVALNMADFLGCSVYELISPPAEDVANGSAKYGLY